MATLRAACGRGVAVVAAGEAYLHVAKRAEFAIAAAFVGANDQLDRNTKGSQDNGSYHDGCPRRLSAQDDKQREK